jgi:hypothetical protein
VLHIRAIARLYGDQGYEVIEQLRVHPTTTAPIVVSLPANK